MVFLNMAYLNHSNAQQFIILLKTETTNNFVLESNVGFMILYQIPKTSNKNLKIQFESYELFYKNFLIIIDYFLDAKELLLEIEVVIKQTENLIITWTPYLNNGIKYVSLKAVGNNQSIYFQIHLNIENFFHFFKCYTSAIIPSLILSHDEKILFNTFISTAFNWNLLHVEKEVFDEEYLTSHIIRYKKLYDLKIDVYNIIHLFKIYLPLLSFLVKANDLTVISCEEPVN